MFLVASTKTRVNTEMSCLLYLPLIYVDSLKDKGLTKKNQRNSGQMNAVGQTYTPFIFLCTKYNCFIA